MISATYGFPKCQKFTGNFLSQSVVGLFLDEGMVTDVTDAGLRTRTFSAAFIKHKEITLCGLEYLGLPYVKNFFFEG